MTNSIHPNCQTQLGITYPELLLITTISQMLHNCVTDLNTVL